MVDLPFVVDGRSAPQDLSGRLGYIAVGWAVTLRVDLCAPRMARMGYGVTRKGHLNEYVQHDCMRSARLHALSTPPVTITHSINPGALGQTL